MGVYELAEKFDVNHTTISQIQTGKRWEHVGGVMRQAQKQSYSPRVPDDIREEIIRRYETDGISQRALAKEFGYSQPTISKIVNEK